MKPGGNRDEPQRTEARDRETPSQASAGTDRPESTRSRLIGKAKRLRGPIVAVAAVGAVLSGLAGYWNTYRTVRDGVTVPTEASGFRANAGPMSVAVLPFAAHVGNSEDVRLADALTGNVTHALSRDYWTRVVAHGQVRPPLVEPKDLLHLGRELHVRYLTVGELKRDGGSVVVLVRLIDAETGVDVWSDRFEFEAMQSEREQFRAAERIERRLWNAVLSAATKHAKANPASSDPWNLFLRASDVYEKGGDPAVARNQMQEVLRLDPDFAPALATEALVILTQLSEETEANSARVSQERKDLDRLSSRAVVLDASDSWAWEIRARALVWLGRWEEALAANARSRALDPGSVRRVLDQARIVLRMGRPDEALSVIQQARAMDPPRTADVADASYFSYVECAANLASGNYREATPPCERNAASGETWRDQAWLVAVYAQQGAMDKAAAAKSVVLKLKPALSIAQLKAMPQSGSPPYLDLLETHYYSGLRKAGFPEK